MSEVVNVVVALAVIVFVFRWATSSSETPEEKSIRTALGFRPKNVTPDMAETISSMFPDMPKENIHYDLLRTGSVEATTNKIIERGFLESPPAAYFRAYPRTEQQAQQGQANNQTARNATPNAAAGSSKPAPSLISRYQLEERAKKVREEEIISAPEEAGGKAAWEATPEKREASLRERKAQMVLAARKRMLEQQEVSKRKTD